MGLRYFFRNHLGKYDIDKFADYGDHKVGYVIPYGNSRGLQRLHIYNPFIYLRGAYKWRYHIATWKFNCEWIDEKELNRIYTEVKSKKGTIFKRWYKR